MLFETLSRHTLLPSPGCPAPIIGCVSVIIMIIIWQTDLVGIMMTIELFAVKRSENVKCNKSHD